jgi:hypothetical protein
MNPFYRGDGTVVVNGMGLYVPAPFNEPWNPIVSQKGMGCLGCAGLGQTSSDLTIGGVDLTSAWASLTSYTVAGIPVIYIALAGGAVLLLMSSGGKTRTLRKAAIYKAQDAYKTQVASIKQRYPGLTARAQRALAKASS